MAPLRPVCGQIVRYGFGVRINGQQDQTQLTKINPRALSYTLRMNPEYLLNTDLILDQLSQDPVVAVTGGGLNSGYVH